MIARTFTYDLVLEYFKTLVLNSTLIQSFVGFSDTELSNLVVKLKPAQYPLLVLYNYQGTLIGNNQRTMSRRTISFAIVTAMAKADDFPSQYTAIADAEKIGLSLLSRIQYDSRIPSNEWLYNNFDKSSVRFSEVAARESVTLYGMEFHFDIQVPEPLVVDPADWTDLEDICS
jgi:hypothetical protein